MNNTRELGKSDIKNVERYADKKFDPFNINFRGHFFDQLNNKRNVKPISVSELTGFFKRLYRQKDKFIDFLKQYREVVVSDNRYNLNIPFIKKANEIIAKTIMRKKDFQTSNKVIFIEESIIKEKDKWVVYSSDGNKKLGIHNTKKDALSQLSAIEISKKKRLKVKETFYKVLENKSIEEKKYLLEKIIKLIK